MSSSTAVTVRDASKFLMQPAVLDNLGMVLPDFMDKERLVKVALSAMSRSPKLLECSKQSWILALQEAGSLGLEPTGVLGQAYLVPRWNKKTKSLEAQFQIGYRGLVQLARRSGEISKVTAEVVKEGDEFDYELGLNEKLVHRPMLTEQERPTIFCYAIAWYRDGTRDFEVMDRSQIDKVRRVSEAKSGPWVEWYDEMARKTVVRRLAKRLPLSVEAQAAFAYDAAVDGGAPVRLTNYMAQRVEDIPEPDLNEIVEHKTEVNTSALRARLEAAEDAVEADLFGEEDDG